MVVAGACIGPPVGAQLITLHSFTNSPDGANPLRLSASGGLVFGVTTGGGTNGSGTIFTFDPGTSTFSTICSFPDIVAAPNNLLVSGNLIYGTDQMGGTNAAGLVYTLDTDGTGFTPLYNFGANTNDGLFPAAGLLLSGGNLYGTTFAGGDSTNDVGTIFTIGTDGSGYTNLHSFADIPDGSQPEGELVTDGTYLYGTTTHGGANGNGSVFAIKTDGTGYTVLHSFDTNALEPAHPYGALVLSQGVLYGTGSDGGANNTGAIFAMSTDGSGFQTLYSFSAPAGNADGEYPEATLTLNGSLLYGTGLSGGTGGGGTIFMINTNGAGFEVIDSFTNAVAASGIDPVGVIWFGNALWGTTFVNGPGSRGTLFELPLPAPTITQQPSDLTATNGDTATFAIVAGGAPPLFYQWYFNTNTPAPSGTNSVFTLSPATTNSAGCYLVVVTNWYGCATSASAQLTVIVPASLPVITQQPSDLTVTNGDPASFAAAASGPGILSYQWLFQTNVALFGATNPLLAFTNAFSTLAGYYALQASNSAGTATSTWALLTIDTQLNLLSFNLSRNDGSASFALANAVGSTNRLWASSNLATPWFPIATNIIDTNGLWFYTDLNSARSNRVRLYRFSTP